MRRLPIIIALLLLTACKRDVCNTPIGEVGRILLADYAEINNVVGGTVVSEVVDCSVVAVVVSVAAQVTVVVI